MIKDIQATEVFQANYNAYKDDDIIYIINEGGTRSSKTYSITQLLIMIALQKKTIINVVRKQLVVLKDTFIKQDLIPMLIDMGIYNERNFIGGTTYNFSNGSVIKVWGVPSVERVKGVAGNILYINEATSLTDSEAAQLMGRTTDKIFIDFNPSMLHFWVDNITEDKTSIYSTYHNNPFVTKSQRKFLESKKLTNKTYYDVYVLGKRGISEFNVFPVWNILEERPDYFEDYLYGFDYGIIHATTLVKIWYNMEYKQIYLEEVFYLTGKSPSQIIQEFENNNIDKGDLLICDYGGGGSGIILDLQMKGYAAIQAEKGPKSIMNGINNMLDYEILVDNNAVNIQRENVSYKYAETRNSINENPIKKDDDTIDAIRYGITYIHKYYKHNTGYDGENVY